MPKQKKGGRPLGSATRNYDVTGEDRRRFARYAEKSESTGLERAIIHQRVLAAVPKTLREIAARFGKSRSLASKIEAQLFEAVLV